MNNSKLWTQPKIMDQITNLGKGCEKEGKSKWTTILKVQG
jgi:hypothetical protein